MDYEVLGPWAEVDAEAPSALSPRVTDLGDKTIGLFSFFKPHGHLINDEIERRLKERFPTVKFSHYAIPVHSVEAVSDEYKPSFEEWVKGVDTVVTAHGD